MAEAVGSISHFFVKLSGSLVAEELMRDVFDITVENSLHMPDAATIILNDPGLKWIDDPALAPGKPIEISASPSEAAGSQAKPIFDGEIVGLEPEFGAATHKLTIRAFDRLHRLARGRQVRSFQNVTDSDVARRFAAEVGLQADIEPTRQVHAYLFQNNQTNLEFLRERAIALGYALYVLGKKLCFKALSPTPHVVNLRWGDSLSEFRPRMTTIDQISSVMVRGWDPRTRKEIVGEVTPGKGMRDIGQRQGGDAVAMEAFSIDARLLVSAPPLYDQIEADQLAKAVAARRAERFIEAEGTCGGNPEIVAGVSLKIEALGDKFSGSYFVTSATHRYGVADGFTTSFSISGQTPSTLLGLLRERERAATPPGLVIGVVTDNQDPEGWGRVKVKYPWLSPDHASDWARVVAPGAGADRGIEFLPEIDDEVLVGFEMGDIGHPYVLGGLWNGQDAPPQKSSDAIAGGKVQKRIVRSRAGHQVVLDDSDGGGSITIADKNGNTIALDTATNALSMKVSGDITLDAGGQITIKGAGPVTVKGAVINLN
jgi:phage protein D/phage baseplate assembly protein gpV